MSHFVVPCCVLLYSAGISADMEKLHKLARLSIKRMYHISLNMEAWVQSVRAVITSQCHQLCQLKHDCKVVNAAEQIGMLSREVVELTAALLAFLKQEFLHYKKGTEKLYRTYK